MGRAPSGDELILVTKTDYAVLAYYFVGIKLAFLLKFKQARRK
jgi:hypothetical protein